MDRGAQPLSLPEDWFDDSDSKHETQGCVGLETGSCYCNVINLSQRLRCKTASLVVCVFREGLRRINQDVAFGGTKEIRMTSKMLRSLAIF